MERVLKPISSDVDLFRIPHRNTFAASQITFFTNVWILMTARNGEDSQISKNISLRYNLSHNPRIMLFSNGYRVICGIDLNIYLQINTLECYGEIEEGEINHEMWREFKGSLSPISAFRKSKMFFIIQGYR